MPRALRSLTAHPIRVFVIWSIGAAAISALIYWVFASISVSRWIPPASQDLAAPVAIALGTAVAFGGSIVAIAIASVALQLQEAQEARENLQAQVELTRLLSEESARFMGPYAGLLQGIRKLTAIMELGNDRFTMSLDNARLQDPTYVQDPRIQAMLADLVPLTHRIAAALDDIARDAAELHRESGANAFASAIFQAAFSERRWCLTHVATEGSTIPLSALPTVCAWLESRSAAMRELAGDPQELFGALVQARLMANSCRSLDGSSFDHVMIRSLLLLGFLLPGGLDGNDLQAGHEIRPPLVELIYQLVAAYSGERASAALRRLFQDNRELARVIDKLADLLPNPVDAVMQSYLDAYGSLRPRLKLTAGGFA